MAKQKARAFGFNKLAKQQHEEAVRRLAARAARVKREVDANIAAQAEREPKPPAPSK